MLVFWLIIAALSVIALLFVIPPLRRQAQSAEASQPDNNRELYHVKLVELKHDLNNDLIAETDYQSAQQELARNLLSDLPTTNLKPAPPMATKHSMSIAWLLLMVIPVLAIGIYTQLTSGLNHVDNVRNLADENEGPPLDSVEDMIGQLAARLEKDTDDLEGWLMLGRSLMLTQRYTEAVKAYQQANKLTDDSQPEVMMALAESLAYTSQGVFPAQADELIQQVLAQDPDQQKALWLSGLSAYQRGEYQTAVAHWQHLMSLIPQDNSDLVTALNTQIEKAQSLAVTEGSPALTVSENSPKSAESLANDQPVVTGKPASISVRVELSPELAAKVQPDDTVFVYANAEHGPRMPLSLVRKHVKDLPLQVTLDDTTSMIPDFNLSSQKTVRITARISKTGQAQPQSGDLLGISMPLETEQHAQANILIDQEVTGE